MPLDPKTTADLLAAAHAARAGSHAPYSKVNVGAALLLEDGRIVQGANVENASYGLTICAERAAIFAAVNAGARRFRAIAVTVAGEGFTLPPDKISPCGACRQVMAEFMAEDAPVIVSETKSYTLGQLLPEAFRL